MLLYMMHISNMIILCRICYYCSALRHILQHITYHTSMFQLIDWLCGFQRPIHVERLLVCLIVSADFRHDLILFSSIVSHWNDTWHESQIIRDCGGVQKGKLMLISCIIVPPL